MTFQFPQAAMTQQNPECQTDLQLCRFVSRLRAKSRPRPWDQLTGSDESRVQGFYPVGGHDHFHVSPGVEAVQLVEQLQHGSLDLPLPSGVRVVPGEETSFKKKSTLLSFKI